MLKEEKERTGLKYMLAESSWYRQECIFARNLYRKGGFGELFYTEGEYDPRARQGRRGGGGPQYWKSDMLPEPMRVPSGHGGSAVFISAEFVNALLEDREPEIDLYESLAMNVPGIVANASSRKDGEQLTVPQFDQSDG